MKDGSAEPRPSLPEQHGPAHRRSDEQGGEQSEWRGENESDCRRGSVEWTLDFLYFKNRFNRKSSGMNLAASLSDFTLLI